VDNVVKFLDLIVTLRFGWLIGLIAVVAGLLVWYAIVETVVEAVDRYRFHKKMRAVQHEIAITEPQVVKS
jgi:hypothetical protein